MKRNAIVTLTEEGFGRNILASDGPALVDFWAAWCDPCRRIEPMIEQLAEKYDGSAKIGRVNVDEQPSIAARYGIESIPTLLFFRNGEVVDHVVGVVPRQVVEDKLNALLVA